MSVGKSQTIGSKFINDATTTEKVRTLARKNPSLGTYLGQTFGVVLDGAESTAKTINNSSKQLDRYTRNVIQTLFSAEVSLNRQIEEATDSVAQGIAGIGDAAHGSVLGLQADLQELLQPVSSAVGSTLGTLTNVLNNPMGAAQAVGNSLMSVIDRVSPNLANQIDASLKKIKLEELQNLPGQMMGSLRNLATAADKMLSVPFGMISDLYTGVMNIMQEVGNLIDSLMSMIFNLFLGPGGVLDSILPMSAIMSFLDSISGMMSFVDSIAGQFGGFSMVTNLTSQVQGYVSQATSMLQNPMQLVQSYIPSQVTQGLDMLRNPEQMLQSLIPPQIGSQLQKISSIPGLGFVGNMGYGLGDTLKTLKSGVVSQALGELNQQAGILAPLFNQPNSQPPVVENQTPAPPAAQPSLLNPAIETIQGVPIKTMPPPTVLPAIPIK
jgi:hypothetical protein